MRNGSSVRVPSTGKPEFAMYGIRRPDGSCRVHASRNLADAHFGLRDDGHDSATHIDATMREVLTVDAPTWGEAFARLFELWENRDRAVPALSPGEQAALEGAGFEALESAGEAAVRRAREGEGR